VLLGLPGLRLNVDPLICLTGVPIPEMNQRELRNFLPMFLIHLTEQMGNGS
jgi:hypothetical protein